MSDAYLSRGVSATKDEVHSAISKQDKGVFAGAFCKIIPDPCGDPEYCAAMHADGAGTKSSLAYIKYKETGDLSAFYNIAQDSVGSNGVCSGAQQQFLLPVFVFCPILCLRHRNWTRSMLPRTDSGPAFWTMREP